MNWRFASERRSPRWPAALINECSAAEEQPAPSLNATGAEGLRLDRPGVLTGALQMTPQSLPVLTRVEARMIWRS